MCYVVALFVTKFGTLRQLAAVIKIILQVQPHKFPELFLLFLMLSLIFMNMQI